MKRATQLTVRALALFVGFLCSGTGTGSEPENGREKPIQFEELGKAGFEVGLFKRLKEEDVAEFYKAYPPDREMLDRVELGPITKSPLEECIEGEAPTIEAALKVFPKYYPMTGRMVKTDGTFEWEGKNLHFRTKTQLYHVDEYHIRHRLEKLGVKNGSGPVQATVEAVWRVNPIDGLRILYMQRVKLH